MYRFHVYVVYVYVVYVYAVYVCFCFRRKWLKKISSHADVRQLNSSAIKVKDDHYVVIQRGTSHSRGGGAGGNYLSTLTIHPVTEKDGGIYVCWAVNSRGFETQSAVLTVTARKKYQNF